MGYSDRLQWYFDVTMASSEAIVYQEFEEYEFYEEWRKALKEGE